MATPLILQNQKALIKSFARYLKRQSGQVHSFETHLSYVLVAGDDAYKIKKAIHVDFVDFSVLSARHFYCLEELRLNRRLAPTMYVGLTELSGGPSGLVLDGPDVPIEFAVKMRSFEQQALWSFRIKTRVLTKLDVDQLASKLAHFHHSCAIAEEGSRFATPEALHASGIENIQGIGPFLKTPEETKQLAELMSWHRSQHLPLQDIFIERKHREAIKECHGDLHSGNILTVGVDVEVFDCLEFSESLRWIDVINDIAFIYMDLEVADRCDLAARFLDAYLSQTGDYEGVALLDYYSTHRALIRSKVLFMRAQQLTPNTRDAMSYESKGRRFLEYAVARTQRRRSAIVIMHGFSGSGKSTVSNFLLETLGAVRIRSDVERKRIHGVSTEHRSDAYAHPRLYDDAATEATYHRLLQLSKRVAECGMPVIIDAAFLKIQQRNRFRSLAAELALPFFIFDIRASEDVMASRISARAKAGRDPSDADLGTLANQLQSHDPLSEEEMYCAVEVNGDVSIDLENLQNLCAPLISAIARGRSGR